MACSVWCARLLQAGMKTARYVPLRTCNSRFLAKKAVGIGSGTLLCAVPVVTPESSGATGKDVSNVEPVTLSSSELIRNAAVESVNSTSALLTHTVTFLLEQEALYAEALERLMKLMKLNLQVLGNKDREDRVWQAMLAVRSQVNESKIRKKELEDILLCSEKMILAAAEAAYSAGAHYAASTAAERLHSAKMHLRPLQEKSQEAEHKLAELEAQSIEETSKYLEKITAETDVREQQPDEQRTDAKVQAEQQTDSSSETWFTEQSEANLGSEFGRESQGQD